VKQHYAKITVDFIPVLRNSTRRTEQFDIWNAFIRQHIRELQTFKNIMFLTHRIFMVRTASCKNSTKNDNFPRGNRIKL